MLKLAPFTIPNRSTFSILKSNSPFYSCVLQVAGPFYKSEAKDDLVIIQTLLLSKVNYLVVVLTRYWSLSQQDHFSLTPNQRLDN